MSQKAYKMSRLSILQIFSRYLQYGGEEGSVFRIGDVLQDRHDLEYFIASSEDLLGDGYLHRAMIPLLAMHNLPLLKRLEKYQRLGNFDCWQVHNVFPAISPGAYRLAFKMGVPVIHYLHNYKFGCANGFMFHHGRENQDCIHGNFLPAIRDATWRGSRVQTTVMSAVLYYTRKHLNVFDRISRWIAISEAQKNIHMEMGIPGDRIDVVPHFLEPENSGSALQFPTEGYGLFVGRLSEEKGVQRLLDAWRLLPRDRKLVIMGAGPELENLEKRVQDLKLDNVEFLGFLRKSEQAKVWQGASFLVVPSIWQEPFGMVVLEAWARARPVVAHAIGALPEIIEHGKNGYLADPGSAESLAKTLEEAFASGPALKEMGLDGLKRLKTHYNRGLWLDRIDGVYRRAGLMS